MRAIYGIGPSSSIPLAFNDAMWTKYTLGEYLGLKDAAGNEYNKWMFAADYGWCAAAIDGPVHGERGPVTDATDPAYRQMWQRPEIVQDMIDDWQATLDALQQQIQIVEA